MSLIGRNHAFIGCGISCQTSHQIIEHRKQLGAAVADDLVEQSSFLNWVYISSDDISAVVKRLLDRPITPASIHVPQLHHAALMLEDFKVWLWHEKPSHTVTADDIVNIASKYEHLRKNFAHMFEKPIKYLVISNVQNNLTEHYPFQNGQMDISLNGEIINRILSSDWASSLTGHFDVFAISTKERWDGIRHNAAEIINPGETEWKGPDEDWSKALRHHLGVRALFRSWATRLRANAA